MKNATSEDFCDDLVVLCFHVLPAMDSNELAAFINTIVRLADQEVERAIHEAKCNIINGRNSEN